MYFIFKTDDYENSKIDISERYGTDIAEIAEVLYVEADEIPDGKFIGDVKIEAVEAYTGVTIQDYITQGTISGVVDDYVKLHKEEGDADILDAKKWGCRAITGGTALETKSEPAAVVAKRLSISTSAPDNPPNGRYEMTGDGIDSDTITVQLEKEDSAGSGTYINDETASVDITFKVDHGKMSARKIATNAGGVAVMTLTSSAETVDVDVVASADAYGEITLPMEFIP